MEIEIVLRPLQLDDIDDEYCSWYENTDGHLNRYSGSGKMFNRELLLNELNLHGKDKNTYHYLISSKSCEKIGNIKIGPIDYKNNTSDLVCLIGNRSFLGKGIASKAILIANEIAFKEHNIRRLHGGMHASNIPSIKAYTKAGWFVEAIFKGYYFQDGVAEDRVCVACLNPFYFKVEHESKD